jgi:hypothetical protein
MAWRNSALAKWVLITTPGDGDLGKEALQQEGLRGICREKFPDLLEAEG